MANIDARCSSLPPSRHLLGRNALTKPSFPRFPQRSRLPRLQRRPVLPPVSSWAASTLLCRRRPGRRAMQTCRAITMPRWASLLGTTLRGSIQLPWFLPLPRPIPPLRPLWHRYVPHNFENGPHTQLTDAQQGNAPRGPPGRFAPWRDFEVRDNYHHGEYRYQGAWPPPDVVPIPSSPRASAIVHDPPMLLCHVCSTCGRIRSAGFHRHHPIIPGRPLVATECRRCKKRAKKDKEKRERKEAEQYAQSSTYIRCPNRSIRIEIDDGEPRGRAGERVVYDVSRRPPPPSPPRVVAREGRVSVGLRALQAGKSPPPDAAHLGYTRHGMFPLHSGLPAHLPSSRIVELSPSPPPERERRTRVVFQGLSRECRPPDRTRCRSPSPVRVSRRERRSGVANQIAAHPAPFRTVMPDCRSFVEEFDGSLSPEPAPRRSSSMRGILRNAPLEYETSYQRQRDENAESELPEIRSSWLPPTAVRDSRVSGDEFRFNYNHERHKRITDTPPSPPIERIERLRIRNVSPPPLNRYEDEIRFRHVSPHPRQSEDVRVRRTSPPSTGRGRTAHPQVLLSHSEAIERRRSISAHPNPIHEDWEEYTESGSEGSGGAVQVRTCAESELVGPRMESRRDFPKAPALINNYQNVRGV